VVLVLIYDVVFIWAWSVIIAFIIARAVPVRPRPARQCIRTFYGLVVCPLRMSSIYFISMSAYSWRQVMRAEVFSYEGTSKSSHTRKWICLTSCTFLPVSPSNTSNILTTILSVLVVFTVLMTNSFSISNYFSPSPGKYLYTEYQPSRLNYSLKPVITFTFSWTIICQNSTSPSLIR